MSGTPNNTNPPVPQATRAASAADISSSGIGISSIMSAGLQAAARSLAAAAGVTPTPGRSSSSSSSSSTTAATSSASAAIAALAARVKESRNKAAAENENDKKKDKDKEQNEEREGEDHEDNVQYSEYRPAKLKFGVRHPDPVVENSSLAAVAPPDITYNLAMPAKVIANGKLSDLQLEAVVYGCMRHQTDLPTGVGQTGMRLKTDEEEEMEEFIEQDEPVADAAAGAGERGGEPETPRRAGFLLGDGAGMGKGRTLAGFVLENMCRGRNKHVWISVSSDLYEDAKRDLIDIGLRRYAEERSLLLGKANYGNLEAQFYSDERTRGKAEGGMLFSTYSTLISKQGRGKESGGGEKSRLDQVVKWCGGEDFDGLLMFDECHKAKNVTLDENDNAVMTSTQNAFDEKGSPASSKTAAAVVELQRRLPRARVVYCSATSVSDPSNLGFMGRLGLWGPGTEHPSGFNHFLKAVGRLGMGAMELHALHLKAKGAMLARTLSYSSCEFSLVNTVMNDEVATLYDKSAELWHDLYVTLMRDMKKREQEIEIMDREQPEFANDQARHREINADSDVEGEPTEAEKAAAEERRKCRDRKPKMIKSLYWGAHQRFFRSLCIASKVDLAIKETRDALEDGKSVVIGLQSTGEARANAAAKKAGMDDMDHDVSFDEFVSAPQEDLMRIILMLFPLPPKPRGVIPPDFLYPKKQGGHDANEDGNDEGRSKDAGDSSRASSSSNGESASTTSSDEGTKDKKPKKKVDPSKLSCYDVDCSFLEDSDDSDDDDMDIGDASNDAKLLTSHRPYRTDGKIQWDQIPTDSNESRMSEKSLRFYLRRKQYRLAVERVKKWYDKVQELNLPPNPLDRLLNELGGPAKVAELTGRKMRQVRKTDYVTGEEVVRYERREAENYSLDMLNVEERQHFQDGRKLVAILSEAASTGISLQADKRVDNQRRRVHITLELPWSADKAIQQLGRTHRSNQTSGPIYKFCISDVGGEKRFAAAVAKRLAKLGALTQGDRRATGTANALGLGTFDIDTDHGRNALHLISQAIYNCEPCPTVKAPEPSKEALVETIVRIDEFLRELMEASDSELTGSWVPILEEREKEETRTSMRRSRSRVPKPPFTELTLLRRLLVTMVRPLANYREEAIKLGDGLDECLQNLEDGTIDKDAFDEMVDTAIAKCKEKRLTFEVLANFWMLDCGLNTEEMASGKGNVVPRFLNRCLGMRLAQQRDMTQYFHTSLETIIRIAKQNGTYDVGIKTLTGREVKFATKPRVFHFRGREVMDERLYMYTVKRDAGVDAETAQRLYEEAMASQDSAQDSNNESNGGWSTNNRPNRHGFISSRTSSSSQNRTIQTGFYIDRGYRTSSLGNRYAYLPFKGPDGRKGPWCPRVYLYITSDAPQMQNKVLRVRPNGKKTCSESGETSWSSSPWRHLEYCDTPAKIEDALKAWKKEFEMADCPSHVRYQRYCFGRHTETKVMTGDGLVPMLNKILEHHTVSKKRFDSKGNVIGYTEYTTTNVVRVEIGENVGLDDDVVFVDSANENKDSSTANERNAENLDPADDVGVEMEVTGEENVGEYIAFKDESLVIRGLIRKYKDDDHYDEQTPSGTFYVKLLNGKKRAVCADEVYDGKRLLKKEIKKLVSVGMKAKNARSIDEKDTSAKRKYEKPILSAAEDTVENVEHMYELQYHDELPSSIVGIELPNDMKIPITYGNDQIQMESWRYTIVRLSEKCLDAGVLSTRTIYDGPTEEDGSKKRLFGDALTDDKKKNKIRNKKRKSE